MYRLYAHLRDMTFGGAQRTSDTLSPVVGSAAAVSAGATVGAASGALSFLFSGFNPIVGVWAGSTSAYATGRVFYEVGSKMTTVVGGAAGLAVGVVTLPSVIFDGSESSTPSQPMPPQSSTQRPLLRASTHPVVPALTSEMFEYIHELRKHSNANRIQHALFDSEQVDPALYKETEQALQAWLKKKLGDVLYQSLIAAIYCPATQYVVEVPTTMPTQTPGEEHMIAYEQLHAYSVDKGIWSYGQYENPNNGQRADMDKLSPAYGTQSLVERLIIRLYQFREEQEIATAKLPDEIQLAQRLAYHRYREYRELFPSNEARLHKALGGKGSTQSFIQFLMKQEKLKPVMRHPEHYEMLSSCQHLPEMPLKNDSTCLEIDYDLQNTIEQIINLGRECAPLYMASLEQSIANRL